MKKKLPFWHKAAGLISIFSAIIYWIFVDFGSGDLVLRGTFISFIAILADIMILKDDIHFYSSDKKIKILDKACILILVLNIILISFVVFERFDIFQLKEIDNSFCFVFSNENNLYPLNEYIGNKLKLTSFCTTYSILIIVFAIFRLISKKLMLNLNINK